jgi:hypothetical protein
MQICNQFLELREGYITAQMTESAKAEELQRRCTDAGSATLPNVSDLCGTKCQRVYLLTEFGCILSVIIPAVFLISLEPTLDCGASPTKQHVCHNFDIRLGIHLWSGN